MATKRKKIVIKDGRRTFGRMALLLLGVLLLIGVTIAVVFFVKSCGVMLNTRSMPFDSSSAHAGTGDGIVYLRGGNFNFYSFKDEDQNYSLPLASEPSGMVGTPGVKAVFTDSAVQIINAPFNIELDGSIKTVRCGSGHIAVYKQRTDGKYELRIYSAAGQQVLQLPSSGDEQSYYDEGRLIDFGFSEANGSVLWTMELDTASGSPRTVITTYDLSRMTNSGIITVQGQLIEKVFFTESSIFAVGTDSLIRYSASDNREKYRVQIYGYTVKEISLSGGSPAMLLVPRGSEGPGAAARLLKVSEKDVAGETAVTVLLPEGTIGCHMVNGMLAAITADTVYLYDGTGKLAEELMPGGASVTSTEKLDEHHILLERSGELTLLTVGK